jgi:phosphatidylglycerol:prolipoprotein diacylglycerol transferase
MNGWIYIHDLDPILLQVGPLRIGWYGVMYALSFLLGYWLLLRDTRSGRNVLTEGDVPNLMTYLIIGVVFGGRLGWVVFYGGMPYVEEPWRILQTWKGGMSFHGGLIGVTLAIILFARRRRLSILEVGDSVVLYVPLGLFFGRLGNFINGELFGKPTDGSWGVVFPGDRLHVPRHPSQVYEALLEGLLIFAALLLARSKFYRPGIQPAVFLLLYGLARTAVEFVRLPDADIGYLWGPITMGQVLSAPMWLAGLGWTGWLLLRQPGVAAPRRS